LFPPYRNSFFVKALFLNFVSAIKEMQHLSHKKERSKQTKELAYGEKTTIYAKTVFTIKKGRRKR
jgi:hypothetical protein